MLQASPGDVVVVRTPGFPAWVIRLGEALQGKPALRNHVAVLYHEGDGVRWYLEGRPSGLGWAAFPYGDDPYLGSPWTVSNAAQPKSPSQRAAVCTVMREMVGTPYDWGAIEDDAAAALHLPGGWEKWGTGTALPGHVVCSSSAAFAYRETGLAAPELGGGRFTEPADWDDFIERQAWKTVPTAM
jgi:hypothetical protein